MTSESDNNKTKPRLATLPDIVIQGGDEGFLSAEDQQKFAEIIPNVLVHRRWFGGKARNVYAARIERSIAVHHDTATSYLLLVKIRYTDETDESYLIPVSLAIGNDAQHLHDNVPRSVFVRAVTPHGEGVLYDAVADRSFVLALLKLMTAEVRGSADAELAAVRTSAFSGVKGGPHTLQPRVIGAEQSNSSIVFGDELILKLFRRPETGINPDFEVGRFLTEHGFSSTPPVVGALEVRSPDVESRTIGILQRFVRNQGDAWDYTLRSFAESVWRAMRMEDGLLQLDVPRKSLLDLADEQPPSVLAEVSGEYFESAALLGERTAQMHVTLASDHEESNFAPEPFSESYRQLVHRDMRTHARSVFQLLRTNLGRLSPGELDGARQLVNREQELLDLYSEIVENRFEIQRTRIHGDYHLGQVLFTGDDFIIIDFEGEPLRTLEQRRTKRCPLRDVAGMLRSFDYAAHTGRLAAIANGADNRLASHFAECWREWVCATFLRAYLQTCACAHLVPTDRANATVLLDAFLLDKAVYELGYEINNRPDWVGIPIAGITRILNERATSARNERVA